MGILNKIGKYFHGGRDTCRLLKIDLSKQEVKFQIKMKIPILTCSITQAINELNLVDHISAVEACYLGGYYGKMLNASWYNDNFVKTANKTMSFLIKNNTGRCQILYRDRSGNICFIDKKIKKEFTTSPFTIVNDIKLISLFNSSQACYIGILAGIQLGKNCSKHHNNTVENYSNKKTSYLKLVK